MLKTRRFKDKITPDMIVHDLDSAFSESESDDVNPCSFAARALAFADKYIGDIDKIMDDLSKEGFITLPNYATDAANGWLKLRRSEFNNRNVVFYHTYTVERLKVEASPHFYFHYLGDAQKIVNSCTRFGFKINHVGNDLIGITRTVEMII